MIPLMNCTDNWVTVPTNSILTIHKQTVLVHPILDEFYNDDPNHDRSSVYALSKGLAPPAVVSPKKSTTVTEIEADGTSTIDALARNAAQIQLAS